MSRRTQGYTLPELMIVLLVVGLLAAIAYPTYLRNVVKSNRADAESQLTQAAQWMERYYATHDTYAGAWTTPPTALSQSPASGTAVYTLSATSATATSYVLCAQPVTTGPNKNDGKLYIKSNGEKDWDSNGDGTISDSEKSWIQ